VGEQRQPGEILFIALSGGGLSTVCFAQYVLLNTFTTFFIVTPDQKLSFEGCEAVPLL
jgi:hypothetical protein